MFAVLTSTAQVRTELLGMWVMVPQDGTDNSRTDIHIQMQVETTGELEPTIIGTRGPTALYRSGGVFTTFRDCTVTVINRTNINPNPPCVRMNVSITYDFNDIVPFGSRPIGMPMGGTIDRVIFASGGPGLS